MIASSFDWSFFAAARAAILKEQSGVAELRSYSYVEKTRRSGQTALQAFQRRFLHASRPEHGEPDRRTKGRTGAHARVEARLAWNAGRR